MMGAKSLLMRPHLLAFCACPPSVYFLSSRYLSIPQRLSSLKTGVQHPPIKSDAIFNRSLSVRATTHQVNNSGSIDSPLMQSMQKKIKEHLNAESVTVVDANGDGRHVSIDVISSAFEGQSAVNRQRMVYKAIWEELQNTVHAVDQMTTRTPSEAA
ncbi:hypothetical protein LguiA_024298 [Lonicera macranthoides]